MKFRYDNGLIYYTDLTSDKLCIFKNIHHDIFRMAHDDNSHRNFHKIYETIISFIFLRKLTNEFKIYIKHCPSCQKNQIQRHKPYESLHFIQSLSIFYHIIVMNFIIKLLVTFYHFGTYDLFIITCKFIKKILLIGLT